MNKRASSIAANDLKIEENLKVLKRSFLLKNPNLNVNVLLLGEDHTRYYSDREAYYDEKLRNQEEDYKLIVKKIIDALNAYTLNFTNKKIVYIIEYHPSIIQNSGLYNIYNGLLEIAKNNSNIKVFSCDFLYQIRAFNLDPDKLTPANVTDCYNKIVEYANNIVHIFLDLFVLNNDNIDNLQNSLLTEYNKTCKLIPCAYPAYNGAYIDEENFSLAIEELKKNYTGKYDLKKNIMTYLLKIKAKLDEEKNHHVTINTLDTRMLSVLAFMYEIGFLLVFLNNCTRDQLFISWAGYTHIMNEANILAGNLNYKIITDNTKGFLEFNFNDNLCDLNTIANYYNYPSAYTMLSYYKNRYFESMTNEEKSNIEKAMNIFQPNKNYEYGKCPIIQDKNFKFVVSENCIINFYNIFTEYIENKENDYSMHVINQLRSVFIDSDKQNEINHILNMRNLTDFEQIITIFTNTFTIKDINFLKLCKVIEVCFNPIGKNPPYTILDTFKLINNRATGTPILQRNLENIYLLGSDHNTGIINIRIDDEFDNDYSLIFKSIFKLLNKFKIKIFKLIYEQRTPKQHGGGILRQYKNKAAKKSPTRTAKKSPTRTAKKSPTRTAKKSPTRTAKKSPTRTAKKSSKLKM